MTGVIIAAARDSETANSLDQPRLRMEQLYALLPDWSPAR
jgi:hypothetical protein